MASEEYTMRSLKLLILGAVFAGLGGSIALAQYPAPGGNILLTPSNPTPPTGSSISVAVTVRDAAGQPIGQTNCTAAVAAQPGSGAAVLPASFQTGATGQATLSVQTGDAAGELRIQVNCGTISTAGVVQVTAGTSAQPTPDTAPKPPATGTGGDDSGTTPVLWLVVVPGILLLGSAAAFAPSRRRRGV